MCARRSSSWEIISYSNRGRGNDWPGRARLASAHDSVNGPAGSMSFGRRRLGNETLWCVFLTLEPLSTEEIEDSRINAERSVEVVRVPAVRKRARRSIRDCSSDVVDLAKIHRAQQCSHDCLRKKAAFRQFNQEKIRHRGNGKECEERTGEHRETE
jgi:hypothetical protein